MVGLITLGVLSLAVQQGQPGAIGDPAGQRGGAGRAVRGSCPPGACVLTDQVSFTHRRGPVLLQPRRAARCWWTRSAPTTRWATAATRPAARPATRRWTRPGAARSATPSTCGCRSGTTRGASPGPPRSGPTSASHFHPGAAGRHERRAVRPHHVLNTPRLPERQCPPIGVHAFAAGGLARGALRYAADVGAEAMQVFVSNPRSWALSPGDPGQDRALRDHGWPRPACRCSCTPRT